MAEVERNRKIPWMGLDGGFGMLFAVSCGNERSSNTSGAAECRKT